MALVRYNTLEWLSLIGAPLIILLWVGGVLWVLRNPFIDLLISKPRGVDIGYS
jgi:hypothetical protein